MRLQYWKMTWKRSLRFLPAEFLVTGVLLLAVAGNLFGAQELLYEDQLYERQRVAVVFEEKQAGASLMLPFLRQMDSVSTICKLKEMERDRAFEALSEGDVAAVMVVPENVLEGIMNGANTPVQVYLPKDSTFESLVFEELLSAGASLLTTAQAEIYAVYDLALRAEALQDLHTYEREIDAWNLDLVRKREKMFEREKVTVWGKLSLPAFYGASGGVLLGLLWGVGAMFLRLECPAATGKMLRRAGVGSVAQQLSLWSVETIWVFVVELLYHGSAVQILARLIGERREIQKGISPELIVGLLGCAMLIAAVHVTVYTLCREQTIVVLLLALGTIGMLFLSGGLVPAAFLPASFSRIAKCFPISLLLQVQGQLLQDGILTPWDFGRLLLWSAGVLMVGIIWTGRKIRG